MLESPYLIWGQDIAALGGWALIAAGIVTSVGVLVSAVVDAIWDRPRGASDEPAVDVTDCEA